jgi:hypothetical protein
MTDVFVNLDITSGQTHFVLVNGLSSIDGKDISISYCSFAKDGESTLTKP